MWAIETRNAIVLENLPKWTPERMIKDVKDKQLRLRIYRAAFASMKRAIMEKAREYGVPVILVNPSHTSTICPIHGQESSTNLMGAMPQGLVSTRRGKRSGIGTWFHYTT
jgi:putative transposase